MTTKAQRDTFAHINAIYRQIESMAESSGTAHSLLMRSVESARKGEREHRAFGRRLEQDTGSRGSVETSARYFAARSVLEPCEAPVSWLDAELMRDDIRAGRACGVALRDLKDGAHAAELARLWESIREIDYSRHIAGRAA